VFDDKAATILAAAKRPVIMAGDAVAQSRAPGELVELAELIGAASAYRARSASPQRARRRCTKPPIPRVPRPFSGNDGAGRRLGTHSRRRAHPA
jgi:hypothetical protein